MKRIVLAGIALALVAINPAAVAEPGWNGGKGRGSHHGGGTAGGSYHDGGKGGNDHGGSGYHAPPPQGKNNAGRRPHYGNGSKNGYYNASHPQPQGKNNAGRRPHYGNGSKNYYAGYPGHGGGYPDKGGYPKHGGGYYSGYPKHGYPYRGGYPYKGWYGHAGYYYPRPYYGRPYPYYPAAYPAYYYGAPNYYGHKHNNNDNDDWPAYLLGGAILGSVLTNVYHNSQAQQVAPANQVMVAPQGRRLLRDLNGNCYERSTDSYGNEMRTELPPSACNW